MSICRHLEFGLLVSSTVGEQVSAVLSYRVEVLLLEQPWETNQFSLVRGPVLPGGRWRGSGPAGVCIGKAFSRAYLLLSGEVSSPCTGSLLWFIGSTRSRRPEHQEDEQASRGFHKGGRVPLNLPRRRP